MAWLDLNTDWVILSACNTAAGGAGDTHAADTLSGLARAFFYAGARAPLVSHWYVDSDGAVKLVTRAVAELLREPAISREEAMRRAMLALIADTSRPAAWLPAAHPAVWAPLVVVGEGGPRGLPGISGSIAARTTLSRSGSEKTSLPRELASHERVIFSPNCVLQCRTS